jgi:hypothetical protein
MSEKEIKRRIEELESEQPDITEQWINAVAGKSDGVVKMYEATDSDAPDGYTLVATGPKGIEPTFVDNWRLWVDLDVHTPPESVDTAQFPVEVLLAQESTFA